MSAPPYMKLYVADYLAETTHLGATEHGAYLLLLMAMWRAGGKLPRDDSKLAKVAQCTPEQWAEIRAEVLAFFQVSGGLLKHKRIAKEMAKYQRVVDGSKKAGKASAAKRANENSVEGSTDVGLDVQQKSNQPEPKTEPEIGISEAKASSPTKSPRCKPARRAPVDWSPAEITYARLASEGHTAGDLERALTRMRDHEYAKPHSDWDAAFRNWVRIDADRKPRHERPDPDAKLSARHANYARAWEGSERAVGRDWKP